MATTGEGAVCSWLPQGKPLHDLKMKRGASMNVMLVELDKFTLFDLQKKERSVEGTVRSEIGRS